MQSKTLYLLVGMGLRATRKNNPVSNPSLDFTDFSIHLWVWRKHGAHRELCKYRFDSSGKGGQCNTTLETNKQTKTKDLVLSLEKFN